MPEPRIVDVHTHFLPWEVIEYFSGSGGPPDVTVERRSGRDPLVVHSNGLRYPVFPLFHDPEAKLAQMDRDGVDAAVVSIVPTLFLYDLEPAQTLAVHRAINDAAASYAAAGRGRIAAMATVPLGDPERAAEELRRAYELGLVGAAAGTSAGTMELDDPALSPFFAAAEELGAPVLLHPWANMIGDPDPGVAGYHLANVIGNPLETFVAACRLLVGGVFDRHPRLTVLLVHGGGAFPYQAGRLRHAYEARAETKATAAGPPGDYLDRLLFDTVVFDAGALEFLVSFAGPARVLMGTDAPFDMADMDVVGLVREAVPEHADSILGGNAVRELGLDRVLGGD